MPRAARTTERTTGDSTAPAELRIGYQLIPNGDLIVKDQGWLEEALPDTEIKWVKFDSGADVNTAMIAGSIDIGLVGSSPVAAGLSKPHEIPYKVPWIYDVIGAAESLVATKDSGVTDVAGLVGKKVGTPFGSTAHYSALAALELDRRRSAGRPARRPAAAGHPRGVGARRHRCRLRVEPDARRPA